LCVGRGGGIWITAAMWLVCGEGGGDMGGGKKHHGKITQHYTMSQSRKKIDFNIHHCENLKSHIMK